MIGHLAAFVQSDAPAESVEQTKEEILQNIQHGMAEGRYSADFTQQIVYVSEHRGTPTMLRSSNHSGDASSGSSTWIAIVAALLGILFGTLVAIFVYKRRKSIKNDVLENTQHQNNRVSCAQFTFDLSLSGHGKEMEEHINGSFASFNELDPHNDITFTHSFSSNSEIDSELKTYNLTDNKSSECNDFNQEIRSHPIDSNSITNSIIAGPMFPSIEPQNEGDSTVNFVLVENQSYYSALVPRVHHDEGIIDQSSGSVDIVPSTHALNTSQIHSDAADCFDFAPENDSNNVEKAEWEVHTSPSHVNYANDIDVRGMNCHGDEGTDEDGDEG